MCRRPFFYFIRVHFPNTEALRYFCHGINNQTMKNVISTVVLTTFLALSCTDAGVDTEIPYDDPHQVSHDMIVLGDRLADPYSVDNINAALKSLYPTKASRQDVTATDLYVRFLPASQQDYDRLEALDIKMMDHPLDYQIVREGDYYHDPSIPDDEITWQYAVVKSGFKFPAGIYYEVLDECYISDHDMSTRADDGIDWQAVEREAFRLTGNDSLLEPLTKGAELIPEGRITVVDDMYGMGEPVGVAGVMVCVNSFVKIAVTYTDEEGYYRFNKPYSSEVRYRIVFRNKKGFGIGMNLLLVPASVSTLGKNSAEGVSLEIDASSDRKLFTRAVVNNSAYDYYEFCNNEDEGISVPPSDLRIWLFQKMSSSSTPMLQHGALLEKSVLSDYLGEYATLLKMFLPDITLGLSEAPSYQDIYGLTVHELSHASHFMQVGKTYWDKYIMYVVKSFASSMGSVYGSGTEKDAGYCEVGEMWGYFMQNSMIRKRYGALDRAHGTSWWFSPQIFLYLEERGLTRGRIFQAMTSEVTSLSGLKESMLNLYPEYSGMITQAFERYDY